MPSFYDICMRVGTDKCKPTQYDDHQYYRVYPRYLEPLRDQPQKLLEIGLGCDMSYGPGRSVKLWKQYLPRVELWEAEYDTECASKYNATLDYRILTGNQGKRRVLESWVQSSGGNFNIIIDDGSHQSEHQLATLLYLWEHALLPGGYYFIEDLHYEDPRELAREAKHAAANATTG